MLAKHLTTCFILGKSCKIPQDRGGRSQSIHTASSYELPNTLISQIALKVRKWENLNLRIPPYGVTNVGKLAKGYASHALSLPVDVASPARFRDSVCLPNGACCPWHLTQKRPTVGEKRACRSLACWWARLFWPRMW